MPAPPATAGTPPAVNTLKDMHLNLAPRLAHRIPVYISDLLQPVHPAKAEERPASPTLR
jgi:hypothetical protein